MKLTVLGAGAWGTALAHCAAARHDVLLWARDPVQAGLLQRDRRNARYLPGVDLDLRLRITDDWSVAAQHGAEGLTIIATPMSGLREALQRLSPQCSVLWLCKGFEAGSGALGHEIAQSLRPGGASGVLSGPSFALEVAQGRPTALVAASTDPDLCQQAVQAFHGGALRIHTAPGLNARAALITRGLVEITRLGLALGARAETFMGLSGLGDLVLTATGALSRNRQVGLMLAEGRSLDEAVAALGHVAEGVYSAATVLARAQALGLDMPITAAVVEVLQGRLAPAQAVARLMGRDARSEAF